MDAGSALLSRLVFLTKYAGDVGTRKETEDEAYARLQAMHEEQITARATYTHKGTLKRQLGRVMAMMRAKKISPSMRSLQFAGQAIRRSNVRMFNCAYVALDDLRAFREAMLVLMNGSGVGYSVEKSATGLLPIVRAGEDATFVVMDTKESWAESMEALLRNPKVRFNYALVRPEGSPLSTGGFASGPEPLRKAHEAIRAVLTAAVGRALRPIDCHDIMCHMASAVHVGGVRRSAMVALFDSSDTEMMTCKDGDWWVNNPQRRYANNSARVCALSDDAESTLEQVLRHTLFVSKSGEPGVFLSHSTSAHWGANPCLEIGLRSKQFCNLTEVCVPNCVDAAELHLAAQGAAFLGTLQASYLDFPGLSSEWYDNSVHEALIGVSLTGVEGSMVEQHPLLYRSTADEVVAANAYTANALGLNQAARATCIKPSGTNSLFLGCSSGIHRRFAREYWRRMTFMQNEPVLEVLKDALRDAPWDAVEQSTYRQGEFFLKVPVVTDMDGRDESAIGFLRRVRAAYSEYVLRGHTEGAQTHNVSSTCEFLPHEREEIIQFMKDNMGAVGSVSFMPKDTSSYAQPMLERAEVEAQSKWLGENLPGIMKKLAEADLGRATPQAEAACAGGVCEVR